MQEQERLAAVRRYDILDTPPDGAFDRITAVAARLMNVPIALVSIVDQDRIWFKSHHGLEVEQIGRDPGFCASCILQDGPWLIDDARNDARALSNPLVAGDFGVQFYLGIPLRTHDGFNLGTLCVLAFVPRAASEAEIAQLNDLAAVVMDQLGLRLSARTAVSRLQRELIQSELREDHVRGLMRELAHRSNNLLAVVQAIASQTKPNDAVANRYASRLSARVHALSQTHDLITAEDWRGARIFDLIMRQLASFVDPAPPRVQLDGPDLLLVPSAAQNLGLALHELAANAVSHGVLSRPDGSVALTWQLHEGDTPQGWLSFAWREHGSTRIAPPQCKAFGHLVLERLAPDALGGTAQLSFAADGMSWMIDVPASRVVIV
jgi:two-component sensor histidine kinase